jgi:predicted DNA-binding transcriptional regulator YafY
MEIQIPPHIPVVLTYEHEYRRVLVTRVWKSAAGNWMITGIDADKGEYRTFRQDRIKGKIRIVKGFDHAEVHENLRHGEEALLIQGSS